MAKLTAEQKASIVSAIARYLSPSEVVEDVKEKFGITIDRQHVRAYNPEQNKNCPEQWRKLFAAERKAFLDDKSRIGVNNLNYRQMIRQKLIENQMSKANPNAVLVNSILNDCSRDEGGQFASQKRDEGAPPVIPPTILAAVEKVYGTKNPNSSGSG